MRSVLVCNLVSTRPRQGTLVDQGPQGGLTGYPTSIALSVDGQLVLLGVGLLTVPSKLRAVQPCGLDYCRLECPLSPAVFQACQPGFWGAFQPP